MLTIELTSSELKHLQSLSESEKAEFFEGLETDDLDSVIEQMEAFGYDQRQEETAQSNIDKRRESWSDSKRKARAAGSTVIIPPLTDQERSYREQLEADNEAWIWEMCGPKSGIREPFTRKFTSQQSQMIGDFGEILQHGGDELLLASRGEGKTSYLRCMVWKCVAQGMVDFIAFISATGPDASNSAEAIKDMMMRSQPFLRYYPEIAVPAIAVGSTPQLAKHMRATGTRFDDPSQTFTQYPISFSWTADEINMPDVPGSPSAAAMMRFRGADSPIRGLNIFGKRPKVVAIDDLDTPDTTGNTDVAKKIIDRVNLDIGGLGTQTEPLARIMLATLPKSGVGVAHHFAATGFPFVVKRFQYLIEKPHRVDLWMEYVRKRQNGKMDGDKYGRKAHKYYLSNRSDMDAGSVVSNTSRFKAQILPDGTQLQVSALQNYYDEWADKGEMFCRCELDNETVVLEDDLNSKLELGHIAAAVGDKPRGFADESTTMIVRGIDIRKIEIHFATLGSDSIRRHRVCDYNCLQHGTKETTVEQAEYLIYDGLCRAADAWEQEGHEDQAGELHFADLTLIDKGWMGNWSEDGERKTWASQPVEKFCMERGLRKFLPAKGAPNYRSPVPSRDVIIGDNWHINRGVGGQRACSEVIWNAEHWHALVEGLFMLPTEDEHAFELFAPENGVWANHKELAYHIKEGSEDLADLRKRSSKTRKAKHRRDHFWDAFAMALVARSVETKLREVAAKKKPVRTLAQMAAGQ